MVVLDLAVKSNSIHSNIFNRPQVYVIRECLSSSIFLTDTHHDVPVINREPIPSIFISLFTVHFSEIPRLPSVILMF